ncbi:MAG: ion transporter [Methyloligellaceae bacterium]
MTTTANESPETTGGAPGIIARLRAMLESRPCEIFIMALIIINAIVLGLFTSKSIMAKSGTILTKIDEIILGIFVVEIGLRMIAYGRRFWTDPWSIFDVIVVGIALIPATGNLSILRAFRILRALRLISAVQSVRNVVSGLLRALPGMGSITVLLILVCYVFAVIGTTLFGQRFPDLFGTLGASTYTLFQVMTLDGWSAEIVKPVMNVYPNSWVYFFSFILVTSFTVLNLFIGIIVEAMQAQHETQQRDERAWEAKEFDEVVDEIRELRAELQVLKTGLKKPPDG